MAHAPNVPARRMGQAASQAARATVESAGLAYIEAPYIADEVRSRGSGE
ncbi:MAG TPA: hypothetical protein VEH31_31255 [Streptosporangiaceae bacterium]|nr:hypothetical protein [Streptosporangiaceae bacterium]